MLEIGFIKEIRTTWINKEMPQTFSQFSLFVKMQFNPFDSTWQPCILQFFDITKGL